MAAAEWVDSGSEPDESLSNVVQQPQQKEEQEQQSKKPSSQNPSSGAYFFPPLWLQRRAFALDLLKTEGIRSISEIGCGEGSLLSVLCEPSSHIDDFPDLLPPSPTGCDPDDDDDDDDLSDPNISEDVDAEMIRRQRLARRKSKRANAIASLLNKIPKTPPSLRQLHLRRYVGLDVDKHAIEQAVEITAPLNSNNNNQKTKSSSSSSSPSDPPPSFSLERDRWEDLRIELWFGNLVQYNEHLDDTEIVIASEVIEHLHDDVLQKFVTMVFVNYRPRIVAITTPNYEFNKYFSRDLGDQDIEFNVRGYPDPTKRTDRVFRDHDHKFEWTEAEFKGWCDHVVSQTEYDYEISGVGSAKSFLSKAKRHHGHQLPTDRDVFATQCAIFRRRYTQEAERSPRSPRAVPLPFLSGIKSQDNSSNKNINHNSNTTFTTSTSTTTTTTGTNDKNGSAVPTTTNGKKEHDKSSPSSPSKQDKHHHRPRPDGHHDDNEYDDDNIPGQVHKLIGCHLHPALPDAGKPASFRKIRKVLHSIFENSGSDVNNLEELWSTQSQLRRNCGGYIGKVIEAIIDDSQEDWSVHIIDQDDHREQDSKHENQPSFTLIKYGASAVNIKYNKPLNPTNSSANEQDESNNDSNTEDFDDDFSTTPAEFEDGHDWDTASETS